MFPLHLYDYDRSNKSYMAKLCDGAYLYRLASLPHCGPDHMLTGGGPLNSPMPGRFNSPHQRTSYCSNNILVCMAEVLYHMYRTVLTRIEKEQPALSIRNSLTDKRSLDMVKVKEINDIVFADARDVSIDFGKRIRGTAIVFPDPHYKFLWDFNNEIRMQYKKGIFYPSARHSQDICVALFDDETSRI